MLYLCVLSTVYFFFALANQDPGFLSIFLGQSVVNVPTPDSEGK